jgi:hypothetical protein
MEDPHGHALLRKLVKELVQHALEHLHIVLVVLSRLRTELDAGVHLARDDCDGKNGECNVRFTVVKSHD